MVASDIGCVPEKGNSHADRATTATGGRPMAYAPGRRLFRNSAAATTPRNSPATGLLAVASAAHGAATAAFDQRFSRRLRGQQNTAATAPSANIVPSPKVTRPDIGVAQEGEQRGERAGQRIADGLHPHQDQRGQRGRAVPAIIIVVRTPSSDIRYGETTL